MSASGTSLTPGDVGYWSALEVKADTQLNSAEFTFDPNPTWSSRLIRRSA
jgi:hypothetical protein